MNDAAGVAGGVERAARVCGRVWSGGQRWEVDAEGAYEVVDGCVRFDDCDVLDNEGAVAVEMGTVAPCWCLQLAGVDLEELVPAFAFGSWFSVQHEEEGGF